MITAMAPRHSGESHSKVDFFPHCTKRGRKGNRAERVRLTAPVAGEPAVVCSPVVVRHEHVAPDHELGPVSGHVFDEGVDRVDGVAKDLGVGQP